MTATVTKWSNGLMNTSSQTIRTNTGLRALSAVYPDIVAAFDMAKPS